MKLLDKKMIRDALLGSFEKRIDAFLKRREDLTRQLGEEEDRLRATYGHEPVNLALKNGDGAAPHSSGKKTVKHVRRRRRRSGTTGAVSFTELKGFVVKAVETFTDQSFTVRDVAAKLKSSGVTFTPAHLWEILRLHLSGVKRMGKQKRDGAPLNVYLVTGEVGIKTTNPAPGKLLTLRQLTEEIIGVLSKQIGNETSVESMRNILDRKGLNYNRKRVGQVLSRLSGLKKGDPTVRRNKGGSPMNVYKVMEMPTIKSR